MKKLLAFGAVLSVATMLALPQASAAGQRTDGYRNSDQIEVSSQRRYYRHYYGYRHHWGPAYPWLNGSRGTEFRIRTR